MPEAAPEMMATLPVNFGRRFSAKAEYRLLVVLGEI
jgi:hypothetical protein